MNYATIKHIHMGAVALTAIGFFIRGLAALRGAQWVQGRAAKILPHIVDTVLLLSALGLAGMAGLNPAATPWVMAKILGLVLYIALGVVALRPGNSTSVRLAAWVSALLVLGWIGSVAVLKNPWGFFHSP